MLDALAARFGSSLRTERADDAALERAIVGADLVIGAVLLRGGRAPRLITEAMVAAMRPGTVIVDVAIDQGGCAATSHPTTHADPTYRVKGVVHYCVANMPGAVPRTSTLALDNATVPYVLRIADEGPKAAMRADEGLRNGLNVHRGRITEPAVAESLGLPTQSPQSASTEADPARPTFAASTNPQRPLGAAIAGPGRGRVRRRLPPAGPRQSSGIVTTVALPTRE